MGRKLAVISTQCKSLHNLQVLIKSPVTFPYLALQETLHFRHCIGKVTNLAQNRTGEHPAGEEANMATTEWSTLKGHKFVSTACVSPEP